MNLIKEAEIFAKKAHEGQKQVTGKPYFEHPKKVVEYLKKWNQDEGVISAGYLHDVVEDCNTSLEEIKKKFGERVAFLVEWMSWVITAGKKDLDLTYKRFSTFAIREPSLVLIKTADILSNLPNISHPSIREWVINKSYPRNMGFYVPFIEEVGLERFSNQITKEFHKFTTSSVKSVLYDYISKKDLQLLKEKIKDLLI